MRMCLDVITQAYSDVVMQHKDRSYSWVHCLQQPRLGFEVLYHTATAVTALLTMLLQQYYKAQTYMYIHCMLWNHKHAFNGTVS